MIIKTKRRIVIDTNKTNETLKDYLSIHLVNMDSFLNKKSEPPSISVELVLYIRNSKSYNYYIAKTSSSEDYSNRNNTFHGFTKFIEKNQLYIRDKKTGLSLVEDDKLVVGAYVRVYNKSKPMVCRKISVRKGHSTYSSKSDESSVYVSRSILINSNKNLYSLSNNVVSSQKNISPTISIETFYIENKWNKIHMACRNGDITELEILIDRGEDISELTGDGWSALHIASQYGFLNIVKVLLDMGIGINLVNNGWSAIEIACNNGHYQVVEYLLDKGADLHLDTNDEYKLLHIALNTKENIKKMMDLLLRKGHIDVNAKDHSGWTALHIVSRDNSYELAKYLIETANAKVNEEDRNLNTPLHIASQYGNFAIVQLLLNNHANINFKNLNGWTALHIACQYDNKNVIQLLIDNKANINSTTFDEWNALHIAVYYNNPTIVKYLLKKKPDLTEKNVDDLTVIDMARMIRNPQIIKLLNEHIATLDSKIGKTLHNQLNSVLEEEEEEETDEEKEEKKENDYRNEIINKSEVLINEIKNKNFINAINIIESNEIQLENIDKNGWTAFHWASYMGSKEVVSILIERNVKIDRKTLSGINQSNELKGKTAKEIASIRGHKAVVNVIKIEIYKRTFNIALEGITKVAEFIPKP
ncbi:ankyrin repeat-containing domain protein [Neocallimastix lanati (nom. inval.)]|nr:ankyrin repeat-containing domain protein [Neocallimastix sp. JGI-2020a]